MRRVKASVLLKRWRKAAGLTQVQFAAAVGVSQPSVCQYEAGVKRPDSTVRAMIEVFTCGEIPASAWRTRAEERRVLAATAARIAPPTPAPSTGVAA